MSDQATVQCCMCGRILYKYGFRAPLKHSGSDSEPYCMQCDLRMQELRERQIQDWIAMMDGEVRP